MNLKIEPNHDPNSGVIQFNDDPAKQEVSGYPFQLEDIGRIHRQQPSQLGQQQQQQLLNNNHHNQHQQQQQQQQQHSTSSSSASPYEQHHTLPHHSRYTDYSSRTIQQPGTPDDDDYRHNYQDVLPLSGHFLASSSHVTTLQPAHSSQAPAPAAPPQQQASISLSGGAASANSNNFAGYHHQQPFGPAMVGVTCVTTTPTTTDGHTPMMQSMNDGKYISSVLQSQPPFNGVAANNVPIIPVSSSGRDHIQSTMAPHRPTMLATTGPPPSNNIHLLNHHMNVTHMDACASPFQSPASTPYPSMSSNYPIQDMMMQDYCSSGCRLYQSTS